MASNIDFSNVPDSDKYALALAVAEKLCRQWESLRLRPYLCPAGVPTIGWGTTRYPDGRAVTLSDPSISPEYATALLRWSLTSIYLPAAVSLCPGLADEQLGAVADFAYNLGVARLRSSTLRKRILAGRLDDVPAELRKWVYASGRRLNGLVGRRESEAAYFEV